MPTSARRTCTAPLAKAMSLRSRCAHWLWQSASPVPLAPLPKGGWHGEAVTGDSSLQRIGRTESSAPTNLSVGADAYIGPLLGTTCVAPVGRVDLTPPSWTHRPAPAPCRERAPSRPAGKVPFPHQFPLVPERFPPRAGGGPMCPRVILHFHPPAAHRCASG